MLFEEAKSIHVRYIVYRVKRSMILKFTHRKLSPFNLFCFGVGAKYANSESRLAALPFKLSRSPFPISDQVPSAGFDFVSKRLLLRVSSDAIIKTPAPTVSRQITAHSLVKSLLSYATDRASTRACRTANGADLIN